MKGSYDTSYDKLEQLIFDVYEATLNSDKFATQLSDEYYENGKKIYAYHVCRKGTNSLYYNNQFVKHFNIFKI